MGCRFEDRLNLRRWGRSAGDHSSKNKPIFVIRCRTVELTEDLAVLKGNSSKSRSRPYAPQCLYILSRRPGCLGAG